MKLKWGIVAGEVVGFIRRMKSAELLYEIEALVDEARKESYH